MMSAGGDAVPKSLERLLLFPYVSGLRFVFGLLKAGGHRAVDGAFLLPPQSTEQVLHPEQFFARSVRSGFEAIPNPEAHPPDLGKDGALFSDTIGEFTTSVLLSQWLPPARASPAAAGWGGDRLAFFERPGDERYSLVWHTHWDTERDAEEFFEALDAAYGERFKGAAESRSRDRLKLERTPEGDLDLFRRGADVWLRIYGRAAV
jgi:hypothetical protein